MTWLPAKISINTNIFHPNSASAEAKNNYTTYALSSSPSSLSSHLLFYLFILVMKFQKPIQMPSF